MPRLYDYRWYAQQQVVCLFKQVQSEKKVDFWVTLKEKWHFGRLWLRSGIRAHMCLGLFRYICLFAMYQSSSSNSHCKLLWEMARNVVLSKHKSDRTFPVILSEMTRNVVLTLTQVWQDFWRFQLDLPFAINAYSSWMGKEGKFLPNSLKVHKAQRGIVLKTFKALQLLW